MHNVKLGLLMHELIKLTVTRLISSPSQSSQKYPCKQVRLKRRSMIMKGDGIMLHYVMIHNVIHGLINILVKNDIPDLSNSRMNPKHDEYSIRKFGCHARS